MQLSKKKKTPKNYSVEVVFKTADTDLTTLIKCAGVSRQAGFTKMLSDLYAHASKSPSFKKLPVAQQNQYAGMVMSTMQLYNTAQEFCAGNFPEMYNLITNPNGKRSAQRKKR